MSVIVPLYQSVTQYKNENLQNKIKYRKGYKYLLLQTYTVQTSIKPSECIKAKFIELTPKGLLTILEYYAWDGASGPAIDTKNFRRPSLVHDAFYQLMRERLLDLGWREEVDKELRRMCREDGMSWLRAWWVFRGVRFGGEGSAKWQDLEILTAP